MSILPSGLSVMFAWAERKAVLCLHAISLPANSAPGVLLTQVSVEKASKEGAEPSGQCDGQINSTESLDWLSNGLKFSHDFNGKPFQEVLSDDGPLNLMDSHLNRPAD